ncbi:glycine-rich domain-containing protein [Portibacter lacus]|uniref:Glycine-rich domain-containing protein n=1 Tax=Portibacter lacus TaxID=1099794 RepID=A0AA37SNA9_9BACT|nr:hypothetical protein [Portibacter lacus]GLR16907.1 hypothetical protein GCM10007940_15220 [Portibacter lacus]
MARFHIYNSDFGNIGTFTGHGRFGINASNPVAALHVDAQDDADLMRIQRNNATKFRIFNNDGMVFGANWANPIADVIRFETPNMFIGFDGDHEPEDRLEVDGDVRITGAIKANEQDGSPGQILTTGADGNITWASPCSNNRFHGFPLPGTVSWTVPDGVTEIMVELWGAGGGAAFGGGGGAGGYVKAVFEVIPGESIAVVTVVGGNGTSSGMSSTATDGGHSSISGTNIYAAVLGGKASSNTAVGNGGLFSVSPPYLSATAQKGESGYPNVNGPIFSGTSKLSHGNGGQSPHSAKNYGQGEIIILVESIPSDYSPGTSGITPGGGAWGQSIWKYGW